MFETLHDWLLVQYLRFLPRPKRQVNIDNPEQNNGLKQDTPDPRDYVLGESGEDHPVVKYLDIQPTDYVKRQGNWNFCWANATVTAIEIAYRLKGEKIPGPIELSERYVAYRLREQKGLLPQNVGMTLRETMDFLHKYGTCPEKLCPYTDSLMNKDPGQFADGFRLWKVDSYYRLASVDGIKDVINMGMPVVIGAYVNQSFLDFQGKISTMSKESTYGGHAFVCYGYNDDAKELLCINSWGPAYKDSGLMRVPYSYFEKYLIDVWTITV